jgi:23S rRNA (adenine2030-N6)-methyltransferase
MLLLEKLKTKEKGFSYFDTHSGKGIYQLNSVEALKTNEFKQGIERIAEKGTQNPQINQYLALVDAYRQYAQYPGSPEIAKTLCRPQDQLVLMELHNQEINALKSNMGGKNISVHHRDGYEGLNALTPPLLKRGLVLIDPSYELASEYQQVVDTVTDVYKKWSSAIYAIWYPLISERQTNDSNFDASTTKTGKSQAMLNSLAAQPFKNLLKVELCVTKESESQGMYGSGLAIVNAPWQFDQQVESCLQTLTPLMKQSNNGAYSVDWLIQET